MRTVTLLCAAAALLLCVPMLAGAQSPGARASAKCGNVTTKNGGKAKFVQTVKARCVVGRRVARRANGRRYRVDGFNCKPRRQKGLGGKLYGCGRLKNGTGQGIGFIYTAP